MGKRQPTDAQDGRFYIEASERYIPHEEWNALSQAAKNDLLYAPDTFLPKRYHGARLPQIEDERLRDLCAKFAASTSRRSGLYVHGPVGVGKTHLVCATMAELLMNDQSFTYFSGHDFFNRISERQTSKTESEFWEFIKSQQCLVFDDFNWHGWNRWQVNTVERMIAMLYDLGGDTVLCFTSNHSWMDALTGSPLAANIQSRMREMFYPVMMKGEDRRKNWI